MRKFVTSILIFIPALCFCQAKSIVGTFSNPIAVPKLSVTFNADSTFYYASATPPTIYRLEDFSEKGNWTRSGDTIIVNAKLSKKIIKTDTFQMDRIDYALNEPKKNKRTRVAPHPTTRCTFAGAIPREIITTDRTISIKRPAGDLRRIFIGCYEIQGTKEFIIRNPNANRLVFNVYSNYYEDGQIRQMKFLVKNEEVLYTRQKENGAFEKDNIWARTDAKLTRQN